MASAKGDILLVEDDLAVSHTFQRMLRLAGYNVVAAPDGPSGLRAMSEASPAAVLVDLRMPAMDGLELVKQIRGRETNGHRTPIAVITGDYLVDEPVQHQLRAMEIALYFKPLWLDDLLGILETLLAPSGLIHCALQPVGDSDAGRLRRR